jgi:hypothetical protein
MASESSFAILQQLHDDQVIGVIDLALLMNTSPRFIYKLSSSAPTKLPPRLVAFGRKLAWRVGTCRAWIRNLEVNPEVASSLNTVKRLGRPRGTQS